MLRPVLFLHRWLGVVVGLLMTIWCLSGFVMMYVDYPRLSPAAQLEGLAPLQPLPPEAFERINLPADAALASARVEMLAGRPVLRVAMAVDPSRPIRQMRATPDAFDIISGQAIRELGDTDLHKVAETFGQRRQIEGQVATIAKTVIDQWNVQAYRRNAPLYRVDYADPAGTQAYISGRSGEVVQQTTRFQRFWGWLGAVPHWLYPTMLREDGELWSQVVIWTSLAGCFLTVTGLWVGIARLRRRRDGAIGSPYHGLWWWHHVFGLFFGLLTLSWVASGLFSMNPWGFLDSIAGFAEGRQIAGVTQWRDIRMAMRAAHDLPKGTVRVEMAPLGGKTYLAAIDKAGQSLRYDAQGKVAPLNRAELETVLAATVRPRALSLLREEDAYYYYSHKFAAPLPVWRAELDDRDGILLYIDAGTGRVIRAFDRNGRTYRWLQDGLHSLDFPVLRTRPVWDFIVLPLLAMVTLVCATGTWMAWNKVKRDLRRFRRNAVRRRFGRR